MRAILTGLAMLAASPAAASGGFSCEATDAVVKLGIESGVTRGMGSPVFNFRGEIGISDKSVAEDLRQVSFEGLHLAQYWLDGEELRLVVYRERGEGAPHGYVEVTVRAKAGDDGEYSGQYAVTAFDMGGDTSGEGKTSNFSGTVACQVE